MARYRVICTVQVPVNEPNTSAHIVKVGTGNDDGWSKVWTVAEVANAKRLGDTFYTVGKQSGKTASVEVIPACANCKRRYLRSSADAVTDNNLDSLPRCKES